MRVSIVDTVFEPLSQLARFEAANLACGAIATFVGRCRAQSGGRCVRSLHLQHYPDFTERAIAQFATELMSRLGLQDALIIHRVGDVAPGEAIVLVATASVHRSEAFEGVQALIDFLKTDAPFWKREISDAGETWIEPTPQDYKRSKASAP